MKAVDVVEQPVPRLADHGQGPVRRPEGQHPDGVADDPVADDPDRMGVRDPDRAREMAGFADPLETGQLAIAIEGVAAGEDRLGPRVAVVRDDHRDAGPDGTGPDGEWPVAADDRGMTDTDTRDIGDRVERTGPPTTDDDPEIPRSHQDSYLDL